MRRWWLWAALGAAALLVSSGQTWVTGAVTDPVLGGTVIEASGTQAGSTLTAGALLAGAALLAGLVGSRPVRLVAGVCLVGAAALAGLPAILSLRSPADVAAAVAADLPGSTSLVPDISGAATTAWPWVGLAGAVLVLLGGVLCVLAWFRAPRSPGERAAGGTAPEQQPARPVDAWDDLSRGQDPTLDD